MSVPPPLPAPDPADDRLVPRPLTAPDWRAWAEVVAGELKTAWAFAVYCPPDPVLRHILERVLSRADSLASILRNTLAVMPEAAHDPSPTDPATSRPFTPPR